MSEDSNKLVADAKEEAVVTNEVGQLAAVFQASARRWELIVYPSLVAFILLASYGFYLIARLTSDMHALAESVDRNMSIVSTNLRVVSTNMEHLTSNIRTMTVSMDSIDKKVGTLRPMLANMQSMDGAMQSINQATYRLQHDMAAMNRNVGRPMSKLNSFMPW